MSDICFSYVSPRPLHWVCQMEQMTNLRRLAFPGQRSRGGLTSKSFPKTQTVQWNPHKAESGEQTQTEEALPSSPSHCKWGSTRSNASVTIKLLQIIVSCQRLCSCRFPKANCKTFKTSLMQDGIEFKTNLRTKWKKQLWRNMAFWKCLCGGMFFKALALTSGFPNNQQTE